MTTEGPKLDKKFFIQSAQFTDIKEIARVHVNSWCETYEGIIDKEYLESLKYTDRERMWERFIPRKKGMGGTLVVKNEKGDVIGFSDFGPAREHEHGFDSEIYAIYLLKKYQKKGIGKNLFYKTLEVLKSQGFNSCYLWVLKDNPTKDFYLKQKGQYLTSMMIDIEEKSYSEDLIFWEFRQDKNPPT